MHSPSETIAPAELAEALRGHRILCEEILTLVSRESQSLHGPDQHSAFGFCQERKTWLPRLDQSIDSLRKHRLAWQRLNASQRGQYPEILGLLRSNQELIMKIIVLDRENEQALLRRGLVPACHLPSVHRQRPHYVADLYRRHAVS